MPQVRVKGIGVLNFPDTMSREEIEEAIKTHPKYNEVASKNLPEQSFLQKAGTALRVAGQGVPIAGQFIKDTPESVRFRRENPVLSAGIELAGGTAATLPLAGPLAAAGAAAKGMGLIPSLFRSATALGKTAAMGGAIGGLDEMAGQLNEEGRKGFDINEMIKSALISGATGIAGPLAGKALSPGLRQATANRVAKSAGIGALGAAASGYNPLIAAALLGGGRVVGTNRMLNRPLPQSLLAALGISSGANVND